MPAGVCLCVALRSKKQVFEAQKPCELLLHIPLTASDLGSLLPDSSNGNMLYLFSCILMVHGHHTFSTLATSFGLERIATVAFGV